MIKTAEFASPKHPDKLCDFIADSILDAYVALDPDSRVAIEVMGGHKSVSVSGEVRSKTEVNIERLVRKILGKSYHVHSHVVKQSPFLTAGVERGGAGDQGIMVGYATSETKNLMPLEYELARNLCQKIYKRYPYDGKVQVTMQVSNSRELDTKRRRIEPKVLAVVASFQNSKTKNLLTFVQKIIKAKEYFINPIREWALGGFDADSGLSGRKIAMDSYGPQVPIGGGSFSGKDYTKVDRSGAYMARKIAVELLRKYRAREVFVKLAYVIGRAEPVMANAKIVYKSKFQILDSILHLYDLTPLGIKKLLRLDQPIFAKTSNWGHFGRGFPWDK